MPKTIRDFRVIPFTKLTPENSLALVERADSVLELFDRVGIRRELKTELNGAVQRLRVLAERGTLAETGADRVAEIDAVTLAGDFFQFSQRIGGDAPEVVVSDLRKALGIGVGSAAQQRQPQAFQSQFWVGMMLSTAGFDPRVLPPAYQGTKPDYIVELESVDIAVEVKRPQSEHSMIDALDHAAKQLHTFGRPGLVCVDLSDCLTTHAERVSAAQGGRRLSIEKRPEFFRLARLLERRAPAYRRSMKYTRVIGVLSFARIAEWSVDLQPSAAGDMYMLPSMYTQSCAGLLADKLERLRGRLERAFEAISGSPGLRAS